MRLSAAASAVQPPGTFAARATDPRSVHRRRLVVGVLSLTATVSYGVLMYAYPVVMPAMQAELGWAQHVLTGAWSLGALVSGIAAIPVGWRIDRHGPRGVMTVCAVVASGLVAVWSRVDDPALLYVVWFGLGACSAGLFYEAAFAAIAQWFRSGRAKAISIVTVAGGLASTIFVPLTALLTQHLGWRDAVLCLGAVLASLAILPLTLLPRSDARECELSDGDVLMKATRAPRHATRVPRHATRAPCHATRVPHHATPAPLQATSAPQCATRTHHVAHASVGASDALRSAPFRWLVLAFALSTLAGTAFVIHLVPILLTRGHDLAIASFALAASGVAKLIGRALFAPLVRRAGIVNVGVLVHASQAGGVFMLAMTSSLSGVFACVVLFGMGEGAATAVRAEFIADLYGSTRYGTVSGVMALFLALARALGPVAASFALSATGAYDTTLVALVVTLFLAGAAVRTAGAAATRALRGPCVFSAARTSMGEESDIPHFEESVL